jgi:hypothetical protein
MEFSFIMNIIMMIIAESLVPEETHGHAAPCDVSVHTGRRV